MRNLLTQGHSVLLQFLCRKRQEKSPGREEEAQTKGWAVCPGGSPRHWGSKRKAENDKPSGEHRYRQISLLNHQGPEGHKYKLRHQWLRIFMLKHVTQLNTNGIPVHLFHAVWQPDIFCRKWRAGPWHEASNINHTAPGNRLQKNEVNKYFLKVDH